MENMEGNVREKMPGSESIGEIEANKSKKFTTHKILIEKEGSTSRNWSNVKKKKFQLSLLIEEWVVTKENTLLLCVGQITQRLESSNMRKSKF